ncbi:MAG: endonuclease MutS2 [Fimbriimonadales bacterium]|nr:MAG: endonuclease MutS2 [Fimbriimonadales bacterium]
MEWDAHTLKVLELDYVRGEWARRAETPMGREYALQRPITREVDFVNLRLQETDDAVRLLQREPPQPMRAPDTRPALQKATKGGVLSPEELLHVQKLLHAARLYKSHLMPRAERYPRLAVYAERLQTLSALEKQIAQCIAPDGGVLDTASERLAQLRRDQQRLHRRLTEELHRLIHSLAGALQEPNYTIRGGRYCLPVRSDSRGRVKGIVHDASASGATLFIEPEPLVELGNRLRELHAAEQEEIEAILYGLSRAVEADIEPLGETLDALKHLDAILAAGRLALDWDCTMPLINIDGVWKLRGARHPMIPREVVKSIDIELGRDWLGVLITGPNTGGKTVSLKTLGLLTLMSLLGLHIPAKEGSLVAIPNGIYADIGDEQSLQQSLSTFSGHMRHIIRYLEQAGRYSLVLLDELGAGTDPMEGAALARAILQTLLEREARVVATTHYGELKAFAYNHPRLINAAMEFDLESLQPTYRLLLGVPGASHAIEIAKRLGLPERVASRATESLGAQEATLAAMIQDMERARRAAAQAEAEWQAQLRELESREARLNDERAALETEKRALKQRAQQELEAYLAQLQAEAGQILRQLRQAPRESKQTAQLREQLTTLIDKARTASQAEPAPSSAHAPTMPWQAGMRVRVRSLGQIATLAEPPNGNQAQVFIGKVRMPVALSDLEPLPEAAAPKPQVRTSKPRVGYVPLELDLHGKRVEEAQPLLEKYLDDALLAGYESVRVQHGKGTGALRQMVWSYLKTHPQVRSYYHPPNTEGGEGVTVVLFKKR